MKILFVSNQLQRNGAPLRLLEIIEYVRERLPECQLDVIANEQDDAIIDRSIVNNLFLLNQIWPKYSIWNRLLFTLHLSKPKNDVLSYLFDNKTYDVIYANSVVTLKRALRIKEIIGNTKIILHLRELELLCSTIGSDSKDVINQADHIIVISETVRQMAIDKMKVSAEKITLAYTGAHFDKLPIKSLSKQVKFIVGGSGSMNWNKGFDFFLQIANKVITMNPQIHFEWIGVNEREKKIIENDLNILGIESNFSIKTTVTDLPGHMQNWSAFLSTAREEALGVAALEAGFYGIPYLAFRDSGGPEEVITRCGGLLADYLNIEETVENILELFANNDLYNELSEKMKKEVLFYDIKKSLPIIYETVLRFARQ